MVCKGDTTQFCGGGSRLSVWTISASASSSTSSSSTSTTTTATTTPTSGTATPTVAGGSYLGCISETNPRALNAANNNGNFQSLEACQQFAQTRNYRYFGLEYSAECYVDDYINPSSQNISASSCKMSCKNNTQQMCGGSNAISLFSNTAYLPRIPLSSQTNTSATYIYQGCYTDQGNPRTLSGYSVSQSSNSVDSCVQLCSSKGYSWAGVEYGRECYCSNAGTGTATLKGDAQCTMQCAANVKQNCGGSMALQVYRLQTSSRHRP